MHDVERIVCLAPSGSLSFAAIDWCHEQQIAVVLLDRSGHLLSTVTPESTADAKLRRAQYAAAETGQDVCVSQWLIRRKLEGQRTTLRDHGLPGSTEGAAVLTDALGWFERSPAPPMLERIETLRTLEGRAAAAYFAAWGGYPLRWKTADRRRVPPHWCSIRERTSPLSANARHAADPCNAILNYAYALLEGHCRQALSVAGFDPACGFLHADRAGRDSLVYDLMEVHRPAVDALVLTFCERTTFAYGDMVQASDGQCRLHPQLARAVVASCRLNQTEVLTSAALLRGVVLAA